MKLPLNVKMPSLGKPALKMPAFKSLPKAASKGDAAPDSGKSGMLSTRTRLVAGTALAVFGIGYGMQSFVDSPVAQVRPMAQAVQANAGPANAVQDMPAQASMIPDLTAVRLPVEEITPTAAAAPVPLEAPETEDVVTSVPVPSSSDRVQVLADMPKDAAAPAPLDDLEPIQTAAYDGGELDLPGEESVPQLSCDIQMQAMAAPAATVDLTLQAACLPNERLTLHHNGMMFTAVTDASGMHQMRVPALSENAVYIASFSNGEGAVSQIDVPTLDAYDRVVVQWRGDAGLGLHALEFGAAYFEDGHIHAETMGDVDMAASGGAGFLMRFGDDAGPEALRAEVYTFPSGTATQAGEIGLSVEAEVTAANCGTEVAAQTLQIRPKKAMRTKDLDLFMPDCDAVGDFLVLKNLLEDLKVASN